MPYHAHAFVDGAYLRELATRHEAPLVGPRQLAVNVANSSTVQAWACRPHERGDVTLTRVVYYDARPDDDTEIPQDLRDYWAAIELQPDTELGFGSTRGGTRRRPPRQKGVDTLIAVDMLVGAFTKIYSVAILIAGDADFVPVVNEVRRQGAAVVVAANQTSLSDDLKRASDRYVPIGPGLEAKDFPPLQIGDKVWKTLRQ